VLNESWFRGMKLYVDEHVLIPRPETEELVDWALEEVERKQMTDDRSRLRVLDVGTGSGCIPIAIKKERPGWEVYACDISEGALVVAKRNAAEHKASIELSKLDFLDKDERSALPTFDLILSNPPYIAEEEKSTIDKHVIEYEPHLALFVPEDDSLIFYRALADFGKSHLIKGGYMLMEIHFEKAEVARKLFTQHGYETELKKDMHGNNRMIKVCLSS
jgi:release factor glutamine methyltransferase